MLKKKRGVLPSASGAEGTRLAPSEAYDSEANCPGSDPCKLGQVFYTFYDCVNRDREYMVHSSAGESNEV